jgi:carbon storage regulator
MLVLSRHRNEQIMIGKDVVITVVELRGDKVRIGIDAPKEIEVHRNEVYDEIHNGIPRPKGPLRQNHKKSKTEPQKNVMTSGIRKRMAQNGE